MQGNIVLSRLSHSALTSANADHTSHKCYEQGQLLTSRNARRCSGV